MPLDPWPLEPKTIKAFDYLRGHARMEPEITVALQRVMRSGQLILGSEGAAFEREFAGFVGADHAVGVGSGTDALILALMAVGVQPGDEVITVANSAVPTASAIRAVGAIPRFVDIDPVTLLMDAELVESAVTSQTRCLLPVHLYGLPLDMRPLMDIAGRCQLAVVEDCAHGHGATFEGTHVGITGDVGCFSFYPTKNLGAYGDGGICTTRRADLADRLRSLRMYGFQGDQRIAITEGRNSRLDEMQAAVLRVKLRHLNHSLIKRQQIAEQYLNLLRQWPEILPPVINDRKHAWHQFVVRLEDRRALTDALEVADIGYGIHYGTPLHQMPAFQQPFSQQVSGPMETTPVSLPVSELAARQVLSLPMFPELRQDEIRRVCEVVNFVLQRSAAVGKQIQ